MSNHPTTRTTATRIEVDTQDDNMIGVGFVRGGADLFMVTVHVTLEEARELVRQTLAAIEETERLMRSDAQ